MSAQDVAITLHDLKMLVPQDGKWVNIVNLGLIYNLLVYEKKKKVVFFFNSYWKIDKKSNLEYLLIISWFAVLKIPT